MNKIEITEKRREQLKKEAKGVINFLMERGTFLKSDPRSAQLKNLFKKQGLTAKDFDAVDKEVRAKYLAIQKAREEMFLAAKFLCGRFNKWAT